MPGEEVMAKIAERQAALDVVQGVVEPDGMEITLPEFDMDGVERANWQRGLAVEQAFEFINPEPGFLPDWESACSILLYSTRRCTKLDLRPLNEKEVWKRYEEMLTKLAAIRRVIEMIHYGPGIEYRLEQLYGPVAA